MVEESPQTPAPHRRSLLAGLLSFIPALALYATSLLSAHPVVVLALLAGSAWMLTAICAGIGFAMERDFLRSVIRRGSVSFFMLVLHTSFMALVLAGPVWWLLDEPSLLGALLLSAALLVALLVPWRIWPALTWPLIVDEVHAEAASPGAVLRRSFASALQLTDEHELFFSHGLLSSLAMFLVCAGALVIALFLPAFSFEMRLSAAVLYALVLVPLASLVLVTRCMSAIALDARVRRSGSRKEIAETQTPAPVLVADLGVFDASVALLAAARSGNVELALAALERGANPEAAPLADDRDQRSALIHAVLLPDLRLLRALIGRGVDLNHGHSGLSPLLAASRDSLQGRPEAVMTLLANGADPDVVDAALNTPLHHAALCSEPIVAALLLDAGTRINAVNRDGMTALGIACANANWTLATFLLDRGALAEVEHAQPAILLAASTAEDDADGVRLLLKRKHKVDARGLLDRTALMAAALAGHQTVVEVLLGAGAQMALRDRNGTNALMEAARSGSVAIIQSLGRRKVDPDLVDSLGRSALMIACGSRAGGEDAVRALLDIGADRALVAGDGRRAVDFAAAIGRWPIVAMLDPGVELPTSMAGELAETPLDAARLFDALRFGNWPVVEELRAATVARPAHELAQIFLGLQDPDLGAARDWILNLGLPGDVRVGGGKTLADALLEGLPNTAVAAIHFVRRGFPMGGAGLLARVLALAPVGSDNGALCELAGELLQRGGDCFGRAGNEATPLHLACALGHAALVEDLLLRGSDPNARDTRARLPLHYALKSAPNHATAIVKLLIRYGADPERAAASGETALGLVLSRADRELNYWLNWPRWRLPGRALVAADLPAAAAAGDVDAVDKLLALGFAVDSVDSQGASALIRAAGSGYAALVVRLLDVGANPGFAAHSGATCLSAAVAARREAVVRTLLEQGVEPDQRLPGGGTPLMIAAALGLPRLAEPLLTRGADPNAVDARGNTALHAAAQFSFDSRDTAVTSELLALLLRHGARVDSLNPSGQDALLILLGARAEPGAECEAGHLAQLCGVLLDKGAAIDRRDSRGVSPLHCCAMHGLLGVVRMLKSRGAALDQLDTLGRTAGDIAALLGYVDVAAELGVVRPSVPGPRLTLRKRVSDN